MKFKDQRAGKKSYFLFRSLMFKFNPMLQSHMNCKDTHAVIFLSKYLRLYKEIIDWYRNSFFCLYIFFKCINYLILLRFYRGLFRLKWTEFVFFRWSTNMLQGYIYVCVWVHVWVCVHICINICTYILWSGIIFFSYV